MIAADIVRLAEVLEEHRWLTTLWRCACEPRNADHEVDAATFRWHAEHLAQHLQLAGLVVDEPDPAAGPSMGWRRGPEGDVVIDGAGGVRVLRLEATGPDEDIRIDLEGDHFAASAFVYRDDLRQAVAAVLQPKEVAADGQ